MTPPRARIAGARAVPNRPPLFNARRRIRPRRLPWIFGGGVTTLPYVFEPAPQAEPPAPTPPDDAEPAPSAAPDADAPEPNEWETYGDRKAPKKPPKPRAVTGFSTGLLLPTPDVTWKAVVINSFPCRSIPAAGGLYIVVADGDRPTYVGEAKNFNVRWHKRLLEAYEAGVIGASFPPVKVWFGAMNPVPGDTGRKLLESALIRLLINGGIGDPLRNSKQFNPITPAKDIRLTHACPPEIAKQLNLKSTVGPAANAAIAQLKADNVLTIKAGTVFEIG